MVRMLAGVTSVLVGVLLLAGTVSAQIELVGGATYNTYSLEWDGLPPELSNVQFNSGLGAYGGAQYWISDAAALGAQFEYFTGSGKDSVRELDYDGDLILDTASYEVSATGMGYLATVTMNLPMGATTAIRPFAAAGMYGVSVDSKISISSSDPFTPDLSVAAKLKGDKRFGGKAGINFGMELAPGLTLSAVAAYRYVSEFTSGTLEFLGVETEWEDLEGLNVSGFSVGAALSYAF